VLALAKTEAAVTGVHAPHVRGNMPESPAPVMPIGRSTTSRLLLQQLGFVSPLSPVPQQLDRMALSEKYRRNLGLLDKAPGRSVHKIGLIYVREGQDSQNEILANSVGSPLYADFVSGLGWPVDVAVHRGYLGGLDRSCSTGDRTLYWSNSHTEVVFHEVVRMPTMAVEQDAQQIQKKKHVGNDFVHVIWCEHLRDYNPLTITSQFNEAHIVIYPLHNGMFRVQVFRNPVNPLFGPLQHGMVVNKEVLPTLVRETAINADTAIAVQLNPEPYCRPYLNRQRLLAETDERYKAPEDVGYLANLSSVALGTQIMAPISQVPPQPQPPSQQQPPATEPSPPPPQ
jgi:hypothetical protein